MKSQASASTRNHGFDGQLTAPNRQTANIVRQSVTLVHSTHPDTKPTPANVNDLALAAVSKPGNNRVGTHCILCSYFLFGISRRIKHLKYF